MFVSKQHYEEWTIVIHILNSNLLKKFPHGEKFYNTCFCVLLGLYYYFLSLATAML